MGNCLSKIPKGDFQEYKEMMIERSLSKGRAYIRRYNDLQAMGCYVCKLVCETAVADRFPPQACDLEWKNKGSRHFDRIAKGKERQSHLWPDMRAGMHLIQYAL